MKITSHSLTIQIRPALLTGPDGRRHLHWIWLTYDDGPGQP